MISKYMKTFSSFFNQNNANINWIFFLLSSWKRFSFWMMPLTVGMDMTRQAFACAIFGGIEW